MLAPHIHLAADADPQTFLVQCGRVHSRVPVNSGNLQLQARNLLKGPKNRLPKAFIGSYRYCI